MSASLLAALHAEAGLVGLVGAGGKKTTMYRLWDEHPGPAALTATAMIPYFPKAVRGAEVVTEDEQSLTGAVIAAASRQAKVAFALACDKRGRHAGVSPERVARVHAHAGFKLTLIKADGARARLIKAPAADEPRLPADVGTVIAVVSARALGRPLSDDIAHRVDRLSEVMGLAPGGLIEPEQVARLLASEQGALKNIGAATVVPLINMVDDAHYERLARAAAERALALSSRFERVVLARMRHPEALVDVVTR